MSAELSETVVREALAATAQRAYALRIQTGNGGNLSARLPGGAAILVKARGTGLLDTMLTVPFTRGSMMKFLPVISPIALTTVSISALTKLSITPSFCGVAANAALQP